MKLSSTPPPTTAELRDLVQEVVSDPARWRPHVRHDGQQRHFACIRRDADVEIWVLCWMPGHDTGFHDHDGSAAAIVVAEGEIREQRLTVGGPNVDRRFAVGEEFMMRPADIHRIQHTGEVPSVTIHAYSPPLARMGQYEVGPDGTLRRHAQSASEELQSITA